MLVPTGKLADLVLPTATVKPLGVEKTDSPLLPVALKVSVAVVDEAPQTLPTPPPPQVCGAVQAPQLTVPPHPSEIAPQFFPCAAQVVGVQAPPAAVTVRIVVTVSPLAAEICAETVPAVNTVVFAVNVPVV